MERWSVLLQYVVMYEIRITATSYVAENGK